VAQTDKNINIFGKKNTTKQVLFLCYISKHVKDLNKTSINARQISSDENEISEKKYSSRRNKTYTETEILSQIYELNVLYF
jgi:Ni,Fe-hydrogenase I large subunit